MKIEQSSLHLEGKTLAWQSSTQRTTANLSITFPDRQTPASAPTAQASISSAGMAAQQSDPVAHSNATDSTDPRMQLLIAIIEALTGRTVKLFDTAALQQGGGAENEMVQTSGEANATTPTPANAGPTWLIRIETSQVREELEVASYSAQGQFTTADGRNINFSLSLMMQRYERQESSTLFEAGNAPKAKDPLVLNLEADQVRLQADEFSFDLNADGKMENLARLAAGSSFLALDRNGNGKIDNGNELFGPTSGDGFEELSTLDSDGNGWIDENDATFSQLQVWRPGDQAQSLKAANVGAIALDRVGTAFTLKAGGETAGAVRTTGLFLSEDGVAKTMQQIDLVV